MFSWWFIFLQPDPYFEGNKDNDDPAEAEDENFDLPENMDLDNMDDGQGEDEGQEQEEPMELGQEDDESEAGEEKSQSDAEVCDSFS